MVFSGYLELGGREIVNAARTKAYVDLLLPTMTFEDCTYCEDLDEVLGHKKYTTPLVDRPSWFDPDNPDTWDFYGLYPLSFEGFEDATTQASVTEFIGDGGAVSPPRRGTRAIRVTGLLVGLNKAAVATGMVWLRQVLRPGACSTSRACGGDHLTYFIACPPICLDSPDLEQGLADVRECGTGAAIGPINSCTLPYERHLYNVTIVDGPRIVEEYDPMCGAITRVEFTMIAGVPSPFGTAVQLESITPDVGTLPSVPDEIPCDPASTATIVKRTQLAPNPGPSISSAGGWQTLDDTYWQNTTFGPPSAGVPGRVESRRVALGGWAPKAVGVVAFAGGYGTDAAMLPIVQTGQLYTVSMLMKAQPSSGDPLVVRGYLEVQGVNAGGQNVGGTLFSATPIFSGAVGYRASLQVEPVAGVVALRISARIEMDVGNALINSMAIFSEVLVEVGNAVLPYFDGSTASSDSAIDYDWVGLTGRSASRMIQQVYVGPITDPDCPPVPSPPRPPVVVDSCIDDVDTYKRFTVTIPPAAVPRWSDLVPILNLTTGDTAVRQLRVRFYDNPNGYPISKLVPCSFIGEFIVSYLPPLSTMTIDGTSKDVVIVGAASGNANPAQHLLYGTGGGPVQWPYMSCGSQYDLAVDVDPSVTGFKFELCVAARE